MQERNKANHLVIGVLLVCYLVPIIFLTSYSASKTPLSDRWQILSIGLLLATVSATALLVLMRYWEGQMRPHTAPMGEGSPDLAQTNETRRMQEEISQGREYLEDLSNELLRQKTLCHQLEHDKEELTQQCEQLTQRLAAQQERIEDIQKTAEAQLQEAHQTINDQNALLEKRLKQVTTLENTARDLKYELKTLIDLTDRIDDLEEEEETPASIPPPAVEPQPAAVSRSVPRTDATSSHPVDALTQLKRCIDIAQKLTGARHLAGHTPRFQDMSVEGYALDLRRLCDSLRSETLSMILLYSQKEDKLLFVNNQVKDLVGWTPEKFVQDFSNLMIEGKDGWQTAVRRLAPTTPNEVIIGVKTRTGESRRLHCHLGIIPTGIFKTHIVGVIPLSAHALEQ